MSDEAKKPKIRIPAFRESPEEYFRRGFARIANTRMKGVPICNPKLTVSSLPFRKMPDGQWVGGIVTPWSLLVIRACGNPAAWKNIPETKVDSVELPGGEFSFMGVADPELGVYQSCSLLSPTWEVGDQATAEAVIRISLGTMTGNPEPEEEAAPEETDEGFALNTDIVREPTELIKGGVPAPAISRRRIVIRAIDESGISGDDR